MNRRALAGLIPRGARERLYGLVGDRRHARWQSFPGIESVPATGQAVLTFDDGPDHDSTPAVLAALDAAGARATFFVLGEQVERSGELVEAIVSAGHEVGVHGFRHLRHDAVSATESAEDLLAALESISRVVDRPRWFRPPYGRPSRGIADAAKLNGLALVYWSAWGLDWESRSAGEIAATAADGLGDGGILLLHDAARYNRRTSALPTAVALPQIIEDMRARGFEPVTLGTALGSNERV
jgi:peptidoglycan/xylan/chitin deacetylase (PgdA/CDA1 family)